MKLTKRLFAGLVIAVVIAASVAPVVYAQDNSTSTRNSSLGTALLLNDQNRGSTLGDLFVLDRLFANNNGGILGGNNGLLGSRGTNLGDLFILDQLFNDNGTIGTNNGVLGGSSGSTLGDLFVLDRLFGNNNNTILNNGNGTNLGDLFILDQLFR